jgi:competence protein ComEA
VKLLGMSPLHIPLNAAERRALLTGAGVLLLAAVFRLGWEARVNPPLFPSDTSAYATLIPEAEAAVALEARRRTPLAPGEVLDPNTAPPEELARLPGVGPALAARVVADRESSGPFRSVDELTRVAGIGPSTLERMAPFLRVNQGGIGSGFPSLTQPRDVLRVDPQWATTEELLALPGIGPALAGRIIADREAGGVFRVPEDLLRIQGIGPALLERIRPHLVGGL